jgi:hypothetical protein
VADATSCVDLVVAPADLTCTTSEDCTTFTTGVVCPGDCLVGCGGTAISTSAAARFSAMTASFPTSGVCGPCAQAGWPTCAAGQCTLCHSLGPPVGCDGGIVASEAGGE